MDVVYMTSSIHIGGSIIVFTKRFKIIDFGILGAALLWFIQLLFNQGQKNSFEKLFWLLLEIEFNLILGHFFEFCFWFKFPGEDAVVCKFI
jgi:hypothetical protein